MDGSRRGGSGEHGIKGDAGVSGLGGDGLFLRAAHLNRGVVGPVSYTHLTLPTIA